MPVSAGEHRQIVEAIASGDVDIAGYLAAIDGLGFTGPFGCEVISDAVRAMTLDDAARRSHDTAAAMFKVKA